MKHCALAKTVLALTFFCPSLFLTPAFASATPKASANEQAKGHPSIQVPGPDFNFGAAMQGSSVEHAFTVKNTGQAVLNIKHVKVA
jgi:hypothetical protein